MRRPSQLYQPQRVQRGPRANLEHRPSRAPYPVISRVATSVASVPDFSNRTRTNLLGG